MHTLLSYRSPGRLKPSPVLFCTSLILRQAADVQEIFEIERLEPWGKGTAKSSVAGQVSLPPPLNRASPAAFSHSLPLPDDVRGCRCAGDHQKRAAGASGQGQGRGEGRGGGSWYNTCLQYTGCNEKGMFVVSDYLQI